MAYSINGKVYTDHPLMDEIVYNCKLILQGIVIKNDVLANNSETPESITNSEYYMMILDGSINFDIFPFTSQMLSAFGFNNKEVRAYLSNRNDIPESIRTDLLSFCCNYYLETFEEKNNYYRMLMGLPAYGTDEYNIYIDNSYLPSNYTKEVDFSKPLHELDSSVISVLDNSGKLKEIREKNPGSNYSYIEYLGDKSINLYTARIASKWDILFLPSVEALVAERFKEIYIQNRDVYLKRTYQEAYSFNSTYYEECMILMVLSQTFNDMIVDVPEWYIRRDIFDIRSVQYFLDSYGVSFFKQIPLKYQIRIVKNLNKLIKYKSSNRNNYDILDIFALKDTSIYQYYLYKKRKTNGFGDYITTGNENTDYELEFIQSKLGDTYDNYIKDQIYRTPYDDITYQDKHWDGEDEHEYIKNLHLSRDFTIEGTKYMSIEYKISLSEYLFQMQYFLGLLLDSNFNTDSITISVPSIQSNTYFKLSNLFIFLFILSNTYDDVLGEVILPKEKDGIEKPSFKKYNDFDGGYSYTPEDKYTLNISNPSNNVFWQLSVDGGKNTEYSEIKSNEHFYDWMKKQYPEMFINDNDRVFGFNPEADLNALKLIISRRHSRKQFDKGFSLEELGVDKFIVPTSVSTLDELISVFNINKECYNNLKELMTNVVDNRDDKVLMDYVFKILFTKKFDFGFYTLSNNKTATSLVDILKDRDYVLYNYYMKLVSESNKETRKDNITAIMNDIVNTLEYYLSEDGLEYLFAFTTVASFNSLINYIYLMINFFKSYKVYFLDPYVTMVVDDRLENSVEAFDAIAEKKINYQKDDKFFQRDNSNLDVHFSHTESPKDSTVEALDIYGHFDPDPNDDYDYDGLYANADENGTKYKDADGGYADDLTCIPFFVLNGGTAGEKTRDLWDLNGANAMEMQDYVVLDGGFALDSESWRKDYWGSAFTYIVDGGSAGTNQFISNGMHTKVVDRQILADVKISNKIGNTLVIAEDGLYLKESWVNWSEFEDFQIDSKNTYNYYSSMYQEMSNTIRIMSDEVLLERRIQECLGIYLGDMRKVIDYINMDTFENMLKNYTDHKVEELYAEFYGMSPYSWGTF